MANLELLMAARDEAQQARNWPRFANQCNTERTIPLSGTLDRLKLLLAAQAYQEEKKVDEKKSNSA